MRLALLSGIFPPDIGGPATHSASLADQLRRRGHSVTVVTLHDERRTASPDVVSFPRRWPWPVRIAAVVGWLVRHRDDYDAIYATGLHAPATVGGRLAGRPTVIKIVGDPAWERGRRRHLTDDDFDTFQAGRGGPLPLRLMRWSRNRAVTRADAVVVPTPYLARAVHGWARQARVTVVPNGADLPDASELQSPRHGGDELHAVYVGRLVAHKRVDMLIDALRDAPGVLLDVVGDGPELDALRGQAAAAGLTDRVTFWGAVPHEAVTGRLRTADVLVSASSYEGLPHTHLEAIAYGCPVVTAPSGGTTDVIVDGKNGVIVEPTTASGFAAALQRLRDDRGWLKQLSTQARETALDWSFERTSDRIETLLERELSVDRPTAVFVGKTVLGDLTDHNFRNKLAVHDRHLRSVFVTPGTPAGSPPDGMEFVTVDPLPALGTRSYYLVAPYVALRIAMQRRRRGHPAGIVCKSPFEAFGVVAMSRLVPPRRRPPIQVELHGDWRTATRLYGRRGRRLLARAADRSAEWTLRRVDRVRAVSDLLADQARTAGCQAPIDVHIAFSDYSGFLSRHPTPMPPTRQVAFVGVFERYKAVDVLLDAWRQVSRRVDDARLVMVGTGSEHAQVARALEQDASGRSVTLTGPVTRDRVRDIIDASRCLVLPSRSEGLPRIVVEAMARARPVVATPVGGIPEILTDGRDGRLVPVGDAVSLADALVDLLVDEEGATAMGSRARARMESRDPQTEYDLGIRRLSEWLRCG